MIPEVLPGLWWILALALAAVFGDSLLPVLPSGTLVLTASVHAAPSGLVSAALVLAVACASFLGDLALVLLARRGSRRLGVLLGRHPAWARAAVWLQGAQARGMGRAAIAARFVPAGRTVLDLALATSPTLRLRQLSWSALAGLLWAAYMVGLGRLNSFWISSSWLALAVSCCTTVAISAWAARAVRRHRIHSTTQLSQRFRT